MRTRRSLSQNGAPKDKCKQRNRDDHQRFEPWDEGRVHGVLNARGAMTSVFAAMLPRSGNPDKAVRLRAKIVKSGSSPADAPTHGESDNPERMLAPG